MSASSITVVGPPDCYIAVEKCGCVTAVCADDCRPKHLAKFINENIRRGCSVTHANWESERHRMGACKCAKPKP